ncbi:DUF6284 family protein [Streptomyces sp. NPDC053560]|uniref:DUF6284 family protein n=1 Tax=Streptomyces sp. NPDC053560 TaxID=3365711 RepID=UPI0037CF7ABE
MKHIGAVQAVVTAAPVDGEPSAAELDAIEREMPVLEAEVELLDVQISLLDQPPSELGAQRLRRARRKVLTARRDLTNRAAVAQAGGAA